MEAKTEANKVTKTGSTTHLDHCLHTFYPLFSSSCCEHHFVFSYFLVLVNEVRIAMMGWRDGDHWEWGHGASRFGSFCLLLLSCEPLYCTEYGGRVMTLCLGRFSQIVLLVCTGQKQTAFQNIKVQECVFHVKSASEMFEYVILFYLFFESIVKYWGLINPWS